MPDRAIAIRRDGQGLDEQGLHRRQRSDGSVKIGHRLRAARQQRELSLDELSRATGLTKGFISQLERDLVSASVASLLRLCDALGIRIGSLFEAAKADLVRTDQRLPINFGGKGVAEYLLTATNDRRIQVILSEIAPGGGGGDELYPLPADAEFVHVLHGVLELNIQRELHVLEEGDSLTFSPSDPHTWRNASDSKVCEVIWVLTPSPW